MKEVGFVVTKDHIFSNGELFSSKSLQFKPGDWIEADFDIVQHTCIGARKIKSPLTTLPYKQKDFLFIGGYRIGDKTVRPFGKLADSGLDTSGYNKNDFVTAVFTLTTKGVVKLYRICFSHQAIFKANDAIPVKLEEEKDDSSADLEKIMAGLYLDSPGEAIVTKKKDHLGPSDKAPVTKKEDLPHPTAPEKKTHTKAVSTFTKKKDPPPPKATPTLTFGVSSSEDESEFVQKSRPSKRSVKGKAPLPPNPPSKPENVKSNVDATKKSGSNRTTPDAEYVVPKYNGRKLSDGSDASFLLNPATQILSSSQSSDSDKDIEVLSKPKEEDWRTNFKKQFPEDFDFRDSGSGAESAASGVYDENAQIGYSDFEEDVKGCKDSHLEENVKGANHIDVSFGSCVDADIYISAATYMESVAAIEGAGKSKELNIDGHLYDSEKSEPEASGSDTSFKDFFKTAFDGDENKPKVPEPHCVKDAAFTSKVYDSSSDESSSDVPKTIEPMQYSSDESLLFDGKNDKRLINPTKIAENQEFMNDEIAWHHVFDGETLVSEELSSAKKHLIVHKFPRFIITFNTWDRNFGVILADNNPDIFQDIKIGEIYDGKMGDVFDCVSKIGMPPLEYFLTDVSRRVKHNAVVWKNAIFDANVQIDRNSKEPIFAGKPCKIKTVRSFDKNFMVLEIEGSKCVPTIIFPAKYMSIIQDYKNVGVLGTLQYYVHPKVNYYWSYVGEFFVFRNGEYNSVYIGEEDSFAAYLKQPQFWDWVRSAGGVKYEHPSRLDYNVEGSPLMDRKLLMDIPKKGQRTLPPPCSSDDCNIDASEYAPEDEKIEDDDYPHFPDIPRERREEPIQKQNVIRQNPVIRGFKLPRNVRLIKPRPFPRPPRQEDTRLKEYLAKFTAKENRTLLQQPFQHQPNIEDQYSDKNPQHMLPQSSSNLDYSADRYDYQYINNGNYQHDNLNAYPEVQLPKGLSRRLPAAQHQHSFVPPHDFLHNDYPAESYSYQPNNDDNYQHDNFSSFPEMHLPNGPSHRLPAAHHQHSHANNDDYYQRDNTEIQLPKRLPRRISPAGYQSPPVPPRTSSRRIDGESEVQQQPGIPSFITPALTDIRSSEFYSPRMTFMS